MTCQQIAWRQIAKGTSKSLWWELFGNIAPRWMWGR
jgi:hypothetical protein